MIDTETITYKQTGLDWMPEVPEHWRSWKVSHAFKTIGSGTTPESGNSSFYEGGSINWINTGDLNDGVLESCEKRITQKAFDEHSTLKIYKKGTLIIAMYGATIGKVSLMNIDGCTNQACCALSDSDVLINEFAFYWFLCNKPSIIRLSYGGGQPNISQDVIKKLRIPTPPLPEQAEIVQYIKAQEEKLNLFIQKKQRFIELLKEQRQIVIHQVVTKGLNQKVKLKSSGIEWLGDIPTHWEIRRLKECLIGKLKYGANESGEEYNPTWYRYIRITDFSLDGKLSEENKLSLSPEIGAEYALQDGDILFARSGATVGKTFQFHYVSEEEKYCYAGYLIKATPDKNIILSDFLFNYTNSKAFENWKNSIFNKATIENIGADKYSVLKIPIPPIEEQKQIVSHIKTETATIDTAIAKAELEIELIREYKEAMIAEAVMGKRKIN